MAQKANDQKYSNDECCKGLKKMIEFDLIFQKITPVLIEEIVEFWAGTNALPKNVNAHERAKQAVYLLRDENKKVIGISTADQQHIPAFKNKMYVFRCLLHPTHRAPGLAQELVHRSIKALEEHFKTGHTDCIGILAQVESEILKKLNTVHSRNGLTFAGFAPNGDPIRTYFFKGARFKS